ncbi:hypothetical protein ACFL6L_04655 [candidate division KSB1 bacterium]
MPDNGEQTLRSGITVTGEFIEATGLGASSVSLDRTEAEAKRHAEEIARMQATELLVEALQGVGVSGSIRIRDLAVGEGQIIQLLSARLKGVRQVEKTVFQQQEDGSWMAACTLQYDKKSAEDLLETLTSEPVLAELLSSAGGGDTGYTGIVIDLRYEFGFNSLAVPVILSPSGDELFSIRDMSETALRKYGGIPVFFSISEAVNSIAGVGNMPLKIIPEKYEQDKGAIYLSALDTRRFLALPNREELLKKGKIALIL